MRVTRGDFERLGIALRAGIAQNINWIGVTPMVGQNIIQFGFGFRRKLCQLAAFGDEVAALVMLVTDDKSLPKDRRKQLQIEHAAGLPVKAKLIKLADKICNLRDMLDSPPSGWTLARKQAYFDWSAQVVSGLRGTNAELESIFDGLYARRLEMG